MGAGSCQPLAKRKGVRCEAESEGSVMSKVPVRGTRTESGEQSGTSLPFKTKSDKLHGHESVNSADIWDESDVSYRGRSHGRVRSNEVSPVETICREKSADAIVLVVFCNQEGLNQRR